MTDLRTPTAVDALAERYLDQAAALNPIDATNLGIAGYDAELPAYDPTGGRRSRSCGGARWPTSTTAEPADANDRITVAALREELEVAEGLRDLGADRAELRNIASPLQNIRDAFDLMPTATADDWGTIAQRLTAVPAADRRVHRLAASRRRTRAGVAPGARSRPRLEQCADSVAPDGFFAGWPTGRHDDGAAVPASVRADLDARGRAGSDGLRSSSRTSCATELLPGAPERDAVGRERYALCLAGTSSARRSTSRDLRVGPGGARPHRRRHGRDREPDRPADRRGGASPRSTPTRPAAVAAPTPAAWMQALGRGRSPTWPTTHFDIPEPIRRLECRIAPTHDGGIYYTGPSEDFTRPGRMWWSVPAGVTDFSTWRELTTVYHEGVPGHHLQMAQAVYRSDDAEPVAAARVVGRAGTARAGRCTPSG